MGIEPTLPAWEAGAIPLDQLCQTDKLGIVPKQIQKGYLNKKLKNKHEFTGNRTQVACMRAKCATTRPTMQERSSAICPRTRKKAIITKIKKLGTWSQGFEPGPLPWDASAVLLDQLYDTGI